MKKRLYIFFAIITILILSCLILFINYKTVLTTQNNENITLIYTTHQDILSSYSKRIYEQEDGIETELMNLLKTSTDTIYKGTYKNALSYYYLLEDDYSKYEDLIFSALDDYKNADNTSPLILETYSYMISNSIYEKDYASALAYCYYALDILNSSDYSFINENFAEDIETIIHCNLINIFYNNNLTIRAQKYYNEICKLKPGDFVYDKNNALILYSKLIYNSGIKNHSEELSLANEYFQLSKKNNSRNLEGLRINLGIALLKNNKPDEALPHIKAAEKFYTNNNNTSTLPVIYDTYGDYYYQKKDYDLALDYYIQAYNLFLKDVNSIKSQKETLEKIHSISLESNLNFDFEKYHDDYFKLTNAHNEADSTSMLFLAMNEITTKSYENRLSLQDQKENLLTKASNLKIIVIVLLLIMLSIFIISTFMLTTEITKRRISESKLLSIVNIDTLTKCFTRSYGMNKLNKLTEKKANFCISLIDIDNFKQINDRHGHIIGDKALILVGKKLIELSKVNCYPIRYGGEEFLIVLENKTLSESNIIMNTFKKDLSNSTFSNSLSLTISGGLTEWNGESISELISKTDKLLYKAKNDGKNKIVEL